MAGFTLSGFTTTGFTTEVITEGQIISFGNIAVLEAIKIFTKDEVTTIEAHAVKDNGVAYTQSEISQIRILRISPRDEKTKHPAITAAFTVDNTFQGTITGTLPIEGYWRFQFEYTLTSTGKPVHSQIHYIYVGSTIIPSS